MFEDKFGKIILVIIAYLFIILSNNSIAGFFDGSLDLDEGSPCIMEDGSLGYCVELPSCPMRVQQVILGLRFATPIGRCSFKGMIEIVCCPRSDRSSRNQNDENKPVTNNQNKPVTNNQNKPVTNNHNKPATNNQNKPVTNNQNKPITNNQNKPITNNQNKPITNNQNKPITIDELLRPAEVACHEFENEILGEDGQKINPNIFNGERSAFGEFPYMVALGYNIQEDDYNVVKFSCGGTLISPEHVLTAAHCVQNINKLVPFEVRLGVVNLLDNSNNVQRVAIDKIIPHPNYKQSMNYYDIAVLKLSRKVNMSKNIWPICVQNKPIPNINQLVNMSLIVTGWGATSFDNEGSADLQKTPNLHIINRAECNKSYSNFSKLPRGIDESMICMLDTNTTRRSDACQGDSGGPLLLLSKVSKTILGVTSFGQSCGSSTPSVYTSVYYHLDWIEKVVWPDKKQRKVIL